MTPDKCACGNFPIRDFLGAIGLNVLAKMTPTLSAHIILMYIWWKASKTTKRKYHVADNYDKTPMIIIKLLV